MAALKGKIEYLAVQIRKYKANLEICTDEPLRKQFEENLSDAMAKCKACEQELCKVSLLDL